MTPCSSDFVLDAAYGNALPPAAQRALDEHLRECERCASRRQLLAHQREQFLGQRELRPRPARREHARPTTGQFPLRMAALIAVGLLWLAIWLRETGKRSWDTGSQSSATHQTTE